MLTILAKILKILNSETAPSQISLALGLALVMGFTPLWSLHNLLVLFLVLVLRINLSAFLLGWALFSALAFCLDPVFHFLGYQALTLTALQGIWADLYQLTWLRLARFNNTILMGSLLLSLGLLWPLCLLSNFIIRQYRAHILAWIKKTRLAQIIQSSRLYLVYQTLTQKGAA